MKRKTGNKGFTMVELAITLIIASLLFSIVLVSMSTYRRNHKVNKDTDLVYEVLNEARNMTIVSKNGTSYGIHFDTTSYTLFSGGTYNASEPTNKVTNLSDEVTLYKTLPGGSGDIVFSRLSGETNLTGTAVIELKAEGIATTTVKVYKTGTIELVP